MMIVKMSVEGTPLQRELFRGTEEEVIFFLKGYIAAVKDYTSYMDIPFPGGNQILLASAKKTHLAIRILVIDTTSKD